MQYLSAATFVSNFYHPKQRVMTPFQRLEEIAKLEKRSVRQLVDITGRNPSIVSAIRNGTKKVSEELAQAIQDHFPYRKEWILTGEGDMKLSYNIVNEQYALYQTEQKPSDGRVKIKGVKVADPSDLVPILKTPLYARAGNGYVSYFNRPPQEQEWELVSPSKLHPGIKAEDHTIVTINGDSMEPILQAGWEMLAYKKPEGQFPRVDKIVMIDLGDELIIKRLASIDWDNHNVIVKSDNGGELRTISMGEIRQVFHVYSHYKTIL